MGVIEEVHEGLDADITLSEFRDAVAAKVADMGDLADEQTAATLVAYELTDDRITSIDGIDVERSEVKFFGKVRHIGELRTFERDDEDAPGHVINVEVVDETGTVRVAFWDDQAQAIDREGLEPGTVLRIRGSPRDGPMGVEVSAHHAEVDEDTTIDVDLSGADPIASLSPGQTSATVNGQVLETDEPRTFTRDDGSEGQVANVVIGDETGSLRVTLWDDAASRATELEEGAVIEVRGGSVRERDGRIEYHLGSEGGIATIEEAVMFVPDVTPIAKLEVDQTADIAGVVRSTDGLRTFDRDDGSTGKVKNIRLQDETGDIRVAIWGDRAEGELGPGDPVWFGNVQIKDGWQDALEAAVNWQSSIARIERSALAEMGTDSTADETTTSESVDLESFTDEVPADDGKGDGVEATFTGTVVQTGNPIILDDGSETVRVESEESPTLGEELTVHGIRRDDRLTATRVDRPDGKR